MESNVNIEQVGLSDFGTDVVSKGLTLGNLINLLDFSAPIKKDHDPKINVK
jgi:hypothetical protein